MVPVNVIAALLPVSCPVMGRLCFYAACAAASLAFGALSAF